jgi:hypothetical protein
MGFHYEDEASQRWQSRTLSAKAPNSPSFEMKCPSNEDTIETMFKPPTECSMQARCLKLVRRVTDAKRSKTVYIKCGFCCSWLS